MLHNYYHAHIVWVKVFFGWTVAKWLDAKNGDYIVKSGFVCRSGSLGARYDDSCCAVQLAPGAPYECGWDYDTKPTTDCGTICEAYGRKGDTDMWYGCGWTNGEPRPSDIPPLSLMQRVVTYIEDVLAAWSKTASGGTCANCEIPPSSVSSWATSWGAGMVETVIMSILPFFRLFGGSQPHAGFCVCSARMNSFADSMPATIVQQGYCSTGYGWPPTTGGREPMNTSTIQYT